MRKQAILSAAFCAAFCAAFFAGCLSESSDGGGGPRDPFPLATGDMILPLGNPLRYQFLWREMDTAGNPQLLSQRQLSIRPGFLTDPTLPSNIHTYSFGSDLSGLLLAYRTPSPESTGVYIVGEFAGSNGVLGDTVPWLLANAKRGDRWTTDSGREVTLVSEDTTYYLAKVPAGTTFDPDAVVKADLVPRQAMLFRETGGDTVTAYFLQKGFGFLGMERSLGGRLRAAATLTRLEGL